MAFYFTLKSLPELRGRRWRERRQAMSQAGLAPYRRWQVWVALTLASLVSLWTLDTVVGNILWNNVTDASSLASAAWIAGPLCVALPALLFFRHHYLRALRAALGQVSFEPGAGWWQGVGKGMLKGMAALPLLLAGMALIDWVLNSFDDAPSPRLAEIRLWPQAIPQEGNAFIAAIGLRAAPGSSPFEAGRAWIADADKAARIRPLEFPQAITALAFVNYGAQADGTATGGATGGGAPRADFCRPGQEACLPIVHAERARVQAWLAANRELLARYQALYQYPAWQYTTTPGMVAIPPYSPLFRGQNLLHATALLAVEQNNTGYAIELLGRDMRFAREMLAAQNPLVGKMVAAALLSRDLALLTELMQDRPRALAPYWHDLDLMLEPLTPDMVSAADTMRFEERFFLAEMDGALTDFDDGAGGETNAWARHHFLRNATSNLVIGRMDRLIARIAVRDAAFTPLITGDDPPDAQDYSRLFGFMRNQTGKLTVLAAAPDYLSYANRLAELNALNNFLHLRVALAEDKVPVDKITDYLERSPSGLRNPENRKPFGWDTARKQIHFMPGTRSFMRQFPRDDDGRITFTLQGV